MLSGSRDGGMGSGSSVKLADACVRCELVRVLLAACCVLRALVWCGCSHMPAHSVRADLTLGCLPLCRPARLHQEEPMRQLAPRVVVVVVVAVTLWPCWLRWRARTAGRGSRRALSASAGAPLSPLPCARWRARRRRWRACRPRLWAAGSSFLGRCCWRRTLSILTGGPGVLGSHSGMHAGACSVVATVCWLPSVQREAIVLRCQALPGDALKVLLACPQ